MRRKLHLGHFAFMRAYVEGLPLDEIWDRYLAIEGSRTDARVVRRTVNWLRDQFAAAAHRHHRPGHARLVRIEVKLLQAVPALIPPPLTLDEFAAAQGLEDFSYAEQVEAYEAQYGGANPGEKRSARLLQKQLAALRWLERLAAEVPRAGDRIDYWLNADLAERLQAAGMTTLRDLVARINGLGSSWYAGVRAIGAGKASRIVAWLRVYEGDTGLAIGEHAEQALARMSLPARAALVPAATDVVPLEKFIVPGELDGTRGRYRAPIWECQLQATNDYDAALAFIRAKRMMPASALRARQAARRARLPECLRDMPPGRLDWLQDLSNTQRAYRIEIERFMLWAIVERKVALSSITFEDATAYVEFLANPTPAERWCAPRSRQRFTSLWRPFSGPLSSTARRRAISVLSTFYRFLVDQRYLTGTPWSGQPKSGPIGKRLHTGRSFTLTQWNGINAALEALPDTCANARLRFALRLLYATGLRRAEAVQARVGDLRRIVYPATQHEPEVAGWELTVVGKGGKTREVPVPGVLVGDLEQYLALRGLQPDVSAPSNQAAHLLGQALDRLPAHVSAGAPDPLAGIGAQTLYDQLKKFFADYAATLRETAPHDAWRIEQASIHWLRHTSVSHAIAAGSPIDVVQARAGHASLATTTTYTDVEGRRRLGGSQQFFDSFGVKGTR